MRERIKFELARTLRTLVLCLLVLVTAVILVYLFTHLGEKSKLQGKPEAVISQKVDRKEKIEHFEFKGEKGNIELRANKFYVGADNQNHLEGNVEVVDFGRKGGQKILVFADRVIYDQEGNHFVLAGKVRIQDKDLTLVSDFFDYDKKTEVFRTDNGVQVTSQRLKGSSKSLLYSRRAQVLILQENVDLEIIPKLETSRPFRLSAGKLVYERKKRKGEVEESVRFGLGKSEGSCRVSNFTLSSDENYLRSLFLKGEVKVKIVDESTDNAPSSDGASRLLQSKEKRIEAEEITLVIFKETSKVQSVEAKENCRLTFLSDSGAGTEIFSESAAFNFGEKGELRGFNARQKIRMVDRDREAQEQRSVTGEEMAFGPRKTDLRIKGTDQTQAQLTSRESDILASEIVLFLKSEDLGASGNVKVILKPRTDESRSPGLFSDEQPLFITAMSMRYLDDPKRYVFSGNIRVWQEKNMIFAKELTLYEGTGEIRSAGAVRTTFPHKPKEGEKEEKVDISAERMSYTPENHQLVYKEACTLNVKNYTMSSKTMAVSLKKEDGKMKMIDALANVVITQESKEGRGGEAHYSPDQGMIILTGTPQLTDKNKGTSRGDKLTFYLSDGRILVENKERERSETVIKREK
jgi:lipopolysaccharide transport protein LptA